MSKVRQAIIYSSISRYSLRVLSLVSTVVVARLLTPAEIGTFAIASAIVMVMSEFRMLGAGMYIVREHEITTEKIRSALGLTLIISWSLGLLIFISGPFAAEFYELPEVSNLFRILSISFFLAPYISIPSALMSREFQFNKLFYIKIISSVSGLISTISLIFAGLSYYALALGYTITIIIEFIVVLFMLPSSMPLYPSFKGLKPVASVGIYGSIGNLFRKATVTVPDMVIGKMGTITQVGIFSRGLGLVEFLSQTLTMGVGPVALPYLSETKRTGGDVKEAYLKASVLLGGLVWPVLIVAYVSSLPVIRLFFGDQWDEAAPLAALLAIWGMFRAMHALSNSVFLANGNERIMVVKDALVFLAVLVGVICSYPYGLEAVALSFIVAGVWEFVVNAVILKATINLGFLYSLKSWLSTFAVTFVCWAATVVISFYIDFNGEQYLLPILSILVVLAPVWFLSLKIFRHPLYDELSRLLLSAFNKKQKT